MNMILSKICWFPLLKFTHKAMLIIISFYKNVTHQNFNKHFHFFPQPSLMSITSLRAGCKLSIDFAIKMGNKTLQNRTYGGIWSNQLLG